MGKTYLDLANEKLKGKASMPSYGVSLRDIIKAIQDGVIDENEAYYKLEDFFTPKPTPIEEEKV